MLIDILNEKKGGKVVKEYYKENELDALVKKYFHVVKKVKTVQHDIGHSHDVVIYICKKGFL